MEPFSNGQLRELEQQHRALNDQVDRLERRAYLTPDEQRVITDLKKQKLRAKDLLSVMRRT
ncbi:MAG TPA: YdcH family protein [Polyangiaceae bacterium]|jgi:uncharacterized protein YdcH (DUF465 family)